MNQTLFAAISRTLRHAWTLFKCLLCLASRPPRWVCQTPPRQRQTRASLHLALAPLYLPTFFNTRRPPARPPVSQLSCAISRPKRPKQPFRWANARPLCSCLSIRSIVESGAVCARVVRSRTAISSRRAQLPIIRSTSRSTFSMSTRLPIPSKVSKRLDNKQWSTLWSFRFDRSITLKKRLNKALTTNTPTLWSNTPPKLRRSSWVRPLLSSIQKS